MVLIRAAIVSVLVVGASLYGSSADRETAVARTPLAQVPFRIGEWSGRDAGSFQDDVIAAAGVDEYINRQYAAAPGGVPISLYVGYYASQRQGDTIHSPQNCLPGSGWQPVESGTATVTVGARREQINRYVVQKGGDRAVVLYWYQGRGRITASEYANKAWLMLDAARMHRTDGGLVRVIAPVTADNSTAMTNGALAFTSSLMRILGEYLP